MIALFARLASASLPVAAPWLLLGVFSVGAGAGLVGLRHGQRLAAADCQAERLAAVRRALDQAADLARQDAELSDRHARSIERLRVVYQPLHDEVLRYGLTHAADTDCLDADGLRIWAAANRGDTPAPAAGPVDYALPAPAATRVGPAGGSAGQSSGGDRGLSPLPGAASSPGRLGQRPAWGWP